MSSLDSRRTAGTVSGAVLMGVWLALTAVTSPAEANPSPSVSPPGANTPVPAPSGSAENGQLQGVSAANLAQMRAQVPLTQVADKFRSLGPSSGYISAAVDTPTNSVTIYWNGPQPQVADQIVKDAHRAGIGVSLVAAPYSRSVLDGTRKHILAFAETTHVSVVTEDPAGTGFTVHFRSDDDARNASSAVAVRMASTRQGIATAISDAYSSLVADPGTPQIRLSATGALVSDWAAPPYSPFGRFQDRAPWLGGAAFDAKSSCTTGFAAYDIGATKGNGSHILTAAHCANYLTSGVTASDPALVKIGPIVTASFSLATYGTDVALIQPGTYGAASQNWDGAWNTRGYSKLVGGVQPVYVNVNFCSSGAYSGAMCGLHVDDVAYLYDQGQYLTVWQAHETDNTSAGGRGDSGGPIFSLCAGNCVLASGIIHGGGTSTSDVRPCKGAATGVCSNVIYFSDLITVLQAENLSVGPAPKACYGYGGLFLYNGADILNPSWNGGECFGIAPDRTIWHAWPGSGGWQLMPGDGRGDNTFSWQVPAAGKRRVVIYVAHPSSHFYQDFNGQTWTGVWYRCATGQC